ncbi:MAG: UDP-glucose--hexose-1-phosphate uridylyltransferase [Bacteroidetes bacterium]|nr:UDP-glucose--hexose-1-phosphate uridylyltransferase [Bacteroidota bacterium]
MQSAFNIKEHAHRRLNILTGEWVLISPHRSKRPWQGKVEALPANNRPAYDSSCYLCPGNTRADGSVNPNYNKPFAFTNDFSALLPNVPEGKINNNNLLYAESEKGICRVICFSPKHNLTLPDLSVNEIIEVINLWQNEFSTLQKNEWIKYIQIFENKGEIMGCSNPHPHGQIWSSSHIPVEIEKETKQQQLYFQQHKKSLLQDYLELELQLNERVVINEKHFVALIPYWAVWPYETIIISKRQVKNITAFSEEEKESLAITLKKLTTVYDKLFNTSFPYSAGMHQQPVNNGEHVEWHWHMHFYPPLLRSATVKKFMVGYEMLASPQRDITPEFAAQQLIQLL